MEIKEIWQKALQLKSELAGSGEDITRGILQKKLKIPQALAQHIIFVFEHYANLVLESENSFQQEVTEDTQTLTTKSYEIRTLDELLAYSKVDLDVWEVQKYNVNQWGSAAYPCFQVKAWLQRKAPGLDLKKQIELFVADASKHAPAYPKIKHKLNSGNMLEISIPDLHYGQLSWDEETGRANYDIAIAEKLFIEAVHYLIQHAATYKPELITFLVGSDFYNVNSLQNTTLMGTKQDEDTRWQKTFTYGRQMIVRGVDMCRELAPVNIVVVRGNHDFERTFYLGDSLSCWYNKCNNVAVDNGPRTRKYIPWGRCLIGMTHGDKEPMQRLPLLMATEQKQLWAASEYREWHIGHLHHKKKFAYVPTDEENGVRVRILPSLCALDAWHSESGYDALREAQGFIWNKDHGNIARFSYIAERGGRTIH